MKTRGDMPAQAQSIAWSVEYNEAVTVKTHLDDSYVPHCEGLTIREELAARMDVSKYMPNGQCSPYDNYRRVSEFLGVNYPENGSETIEQHMIMEAKLQVMKADILLAELAKGGEDE